MKKIILSLTTLIFLSSAFAQMKTEDVKKKTDAHVSNLTATKEIKDGWHFGGTFNLSLTESGINAAWKSVKVDEDESSIGIRAIADFTWDYKKGKTNIYNSFRGRYGVLKSSSLGNEFKKNDDYLYFSTLYSRKISEKWSLAAFGSLESQFESSFLTPGYIKAGPGFLYKPSKPFSLLLSPAMASLTTKLRPSVRNISLYGVDSGKTILFGIGAFAQGKYDATIAKGINYKSVGTLYADYTVNIGNIVVDWNNLFTLTVNKHIGATVSFNLRYNDLEVARTQIQHGLGIGLSYKL